MTMMRRRSYLLGTLMKISLTHCSRVSRVSAQQHHNSVSFPLAAQHANVSCSLDSIRTAEYVSDLQSDISLLVFTTCCALSISTSFVQIDFYWLHWTSWRVRAESVECRHLHSFLMNLTVPHLLSTSSFTFCVLRAVQPHSTVVWWRLVSLCSYLWTERRASCSEPSSISSRSVGAAGRCWSVSLWARALMSERYLTGAHVQ